MLRSSLKQYQVSALPATSQPPHRPCSPLNKGRLRVIGMTLARRCIALSHLALHSSIDLRIPHHLSWAHHTQPSPSMSRLALLPADAFTSVASFLTFDDLLPLTACSRSLLTVRSVFAHPISAHPIQSVLIRVSIPVLSPPPACSVGGKGLEEPWHPLSQCLCLVVLTLVILIPVALLPHHDRNTAWATMP